VHLLLWLRVVAILNNPELEDVMCCFAKEHAEMESPSAVALIFVTFNRQLFARVGRVRRVMSTVNEFCALMPASHDSYPIMFVSNYAVLHARSQSFLGHNVLFCARLGLVRLII